MDRGPTFMPEVEKEITAYIAKLKSCRFGTTFADCIKYTYEAAEENGLKHIFNKDLKKAGNYITVLRSVITAGRM